MGGIIAAPVNSQPIVATGGTSGRTLSNHLNDVINVRDFGAIGDGSSDDTTALTNAAAYSASSGKALRFPQGTYVYNGPGIPTIPASIIGEGQTASVILIQSNSFFIDSNSGYTHLTVSGMQFTGGKGAIHLTSTAVNVRYQAVISDNLFKNYSVCAIGTNYSDNPYWKIERNTFYGALSSISIALKGYADSSIINNNSFLGALYSIKIGKGPIIISENDFIRFNPGGNNPVLTDIWIVAGASNVRIERNKFGNENTSTGDIRVLIADENISANDFSIDQHSSSESVVSTSSVVVQNNYIVANANAERGIIVTYASNLIAIRFDQNNYYGASYPYLVESVPGLNTTTYDANNIIIETNSYNMIGTTLPTQISNQPGFAFAVDPFGWFADDLSYLPHRHGNDGEASFVDLANGLGLNAASGLTAFNSTISATTDIYGGNTAASVSMTSSVGGFLLALTAGNIVVGKQFIIEIDVKLSSALPVSAMSLNVSQNSTNFQFYRSFRLGSNWKTLRFLGFSRTTSGYYYLQGAGLGYSAGVATNFDVGRVRIYYATDPVNHGHVKTHGNGSWNGPHMIMGAYHLWVTSSGVLRIKNGSPTSETDGSVVGSQT